MKLPLLLLTASLGLAQVPTISKIAVSDVTHNSAQLRFTASPNTSWVSYELGTVSGVYAAQTGPNYLVSADGANTSASFAISGLAPSTTYYLRPTAQPNQANQTDICNANGCGATEQVFTTQADPSLPVAPIAPTPYSVPNPDTSSYIIVRMIPGGAGGECKAAASVGTVTAGDLMQTVLNEVTRGYVLEFDQGSACTVPSNQAFVHAGYLLPHKSTGSGYVVLRTKSVAASDFPPFGTRTSPTLCAKCAVFTATIQSTSPYGAGQVFYTDESNGGSNNYIIQNLWLTVDQTQTSGSWGGLVTIGNGLLLTTADHDIVLDRVVMRGGATGSNTLLAVGLEGINLAVVSSWIDQIWDSSAPYYYAQGIYSQPGGTGPYAIDNNYIACVCMTWYQDTSNALLAANDVTITHNTFYWPQRLNNRGYYARQQVEFKTGHRILLQGNLIDGCWAQTTVCQTINVSGINSWFPGDGVSDFNANYNLIRNAATVFDCMGVRPADNSGTNGGPENTQNQRIWLQNTWAYNLGYYNNVSNNPSPANLAVSELITHRSGCADFTVDHNTFGLSNPQTNYGGGLYSNWAVLYLVGGGSTHAANFTHTHNIEYVNVGASGSRVFADQPQMNSSYPELPAHLDSSNPSNTPAQILNTWSVHTTNGTATPSLTWSGNVNICGLKGIGVNTYADLNSVDCKTYQTGMPSTGGGDTWAIGSTIAEREASVGFDPATGICSGCGGAGVDISALYRAMNVVTGISVSKASTSAMFNYTAPDTRACDIDTSPDGTSWTRTVDAGGSSFRATTVTGLAVGTLYYRILCYFSQTPPLFSGSQITDGILTSGVASSPCDVNKDGVTNVADVQMGVNMSLGTIPCTLSLTGTGTCSVIDVQRIVNAALGGACVTGQ